MLWWAMASEQAFVEPISGDICILDDGRPFSLVEDT